MSNEDEIEVMNDKEFYDFFFKDYVIEESTKMLVELRQTKGKLSKLEEPIVDQKRQATEIEAEHAMRLKKRIREIEEKLREYQL